MIESAQVYAIVYIYVKVSMYASECARACVFLYVHLRSCVCVSTPVSVYVCV